MKMNRKEEVKVLKRQNKKSTNTKVDREVTRLYNLIKDHADESHLTWMNPSKMGIESVRNILEGVVQIHFDLEKEADEVPNLIVYLFLESSAERAEKIVQPFVMYTMGSGNPEAPEVKHVVEKVLCYMHHTLMKPHMDEVIGDPEFDGNRMAMEAIQILKKITILSNK